MMPASMKASLNTATTLAEKRSRGVLTPLVTRHQSADGVPIVEGHVDSLQVAVDGHPHLEHDPR